MNRSPTMGRPQEVMMSIATSLQTQKSLRFEHYPHRGECDRGSRWLKPITQKQERQEEHSWVDSPKLKRS